ncbi:MAG TPA: hypothetical protein VK197_06405, partial [Verrucomicrobiae bacterium]|nr:hypothetical protein [Verrucomicrobiae bacterium]
APPRPRKRERAVLAARPHHAVRAHSCTPYRPSVTPSRTRCTHRPAMQPLPVQRVVQRCLRPQSTQKSAPRHTSQRV